MKIIKRLGLEKGNENVKVLPVPRDDSIISQAIHHHPLTLTHRLKTGNRTRFIELLFYIYFEIWADYTQGLLYIIFILSFFKNVQ